VEGPASDTGRRSTAAGAAVRAESPSAPRHPGGGEAVADWQSMASAGAVTIPPLAAAVAAQFAAVPGVEAVALGGSAASSVAGAAHALLDGLDEVLVPLGLVRPPAPGG
jgi:hypothetical protein